jgi:hypothetical protein
VKKYHFGLGNILKFRAVQEAEARAIMLAAEREAEVATAELDARLAAIGAARPFPARRSVSDFQDQRDQLERHALAVAAARAVEANSLAAMRIARAEWEETAKAVRALERLDDRQRVAWLLEATRAAQAATDEIAQTHANRARR